MAEGPQVHRIADALERALRGRVLIQVQLTPTRLRAYEDRLAAARIVSVEAHGKHLIIRFEHGLVLHSHLMMWGRWEIVRSGRTPRKTTGRLWARLVTSSHEALQYNGPVLEILRQEEAQNHPTLSTLGPDPLRPDYQRPLLLQRLEYVPQPHRILAEVLLDQRLFAGVGNIYKSESLWQARLHPLRSLHTLTLEERERLVEAVERVLRTAYRQRFGTLPRNLWATLGPFAVYRRAGRPCLWCGGVVRRLATRRATYFCPRCQPLLVP